MATQCQPASVSLSRSSSRARRRNRPSPANVRSTTHRRGSSTNPFLAPVCLTTSDRIPFRRASSAGPSPVYPWSTNATSPVRPVTSCTRAANSATRSRSLAAVTRNASRCPSVSTATCTLDPSFLLAPSGPARPPPSGVDCRVRPSRIAAVGWPSRPSTARRITRRSWATSSNTPAAIHRRACRYTAEAGGKSWGRKSHWHPAFTTHRIASNTSRKAYSRGGASSRVRVRYGTRNSRSASETSLGYDFRASLTHLTYPRTCR